MVPKKEETEYHFEMLDPSVRDYIITLLPSNLLGDNCHGSIVLVTEQFLQFLPSDL